MTHDAILLRAGPALDRAGPASVRGREQPALLSEDYLRDVPVAPEALLSRLSAELAKRPGRALLVLKVHAEWVGLVYGDRFVVWERSGHATQARGRIVRRSGGSRVEARIAPTRRTLVLAAVFFALFAAAAYGLLGRAEGLGHGPLGIGLAMAGAGVLAWLFWSATERQRRALRAFLDGVFLREA